MKLINVPLLASLFLALRSLSLFAADPTLSIVQASDGSVVLRWPTSAGGFLPEETANLGTINWTVVGGSIADDGTTRSLSVPPLAQTRFYRLRGGGSLNAVSETSPNQGENGVAVTRETIFHLVAPLASNVVLKTDAIFAEQGGRRLLARAELSSDRKKITLFYLEDLPASAVVRVTLVGDDLLDAKGVPLDADGDGIAGGSARLEFSTASISDLVETGVIGHVYASQMSPGGANLPLEGVVITVDGAEETLRTRTDANGFFRLHPAPAGRFFVHIDGRTSPASAWPNGAYYPFVGKAWEGIAGASEIPAGGTGEIFLPLISAQTLQPVSTTVETMISFPPAIVATNPALAGVAVFVPANALFSDNGARGGRVGIAPVPPDRLPEPLPAGLNLPLVITIQTDGAQNFDRPVPVRFPNLPDPITGRKLLAGAKSMLWSFNHDTGRWEPQGAMTITPDGNFAVTDPGVGVRQPGWHGNAPGGPGDGPKHKKNDKHDETEEEKRRRCHDPYLTMWFTATDCDSDIGLLSGGLSGGDSCAVGFAVNSWRVARDCAVYADLDQCGKSALANFISGLIGCIPKVGGYINAGLCLYNSEQGIVDYYKCLNANQRAKLQSQAVLLPPGFSEFHDNITLQIELSRSILALITNLTGSAVWAQGNTAPQFDAYDSIFAAIQSALLEESSGGRLLTSEERASILALPRPSYANANDVSLLIDRMVSFDNGILVQDLALRGSVTNALNAVIAQAEAAQTAGWQSMVDGYFRAQEWLSAYIEPGAASEDFPAGPHDYFLLDARTGFQRRGQLNASGNFDGLILAPENDYYVSYFDRKTGGAGAAFFRSAPAGQTTGVPRAVLLREGMRDTDHDGLSDLAELTLGSNLLLADSDGDGVSDGVEVAQGLSPVSEQIRPTGVIAAADTPGSALDVWAEGEYAYVADGTAGLAVFKLNNFENPVRIAQVATAGQALSIAGENSLLAIAEGATGATGVAVFDVKTPSTPQLIAQVSTEASVNAVAVHEGLIFAALESTVAVIDGKTGEIVQTIRQWTKRLDAVQAVGQFLYVLSSDELTILSAIEGHYRVVSRLPVSGFASPLEIGRKLFVGLDYAYVGTFTGYKVVDIRDRTRPILAGEPATTQAAVHHLTLDGNGLLVMVSSFAGGSTLAVSLYDVQEPTATTNFLTSFMTGGTPRSLTLHHGLALVAADSGGLQVVNYLPPDLGANPPTVSLLPNFSGNPLQVESKQVASVIAVATDDVQVREVELYLDDRLVSAKGSYPFELVFTAPTNSPAKTNFVLRAKATDLAGSFSWSDPLTIMLVEDATPPRLVELDPVEGSTLAPNIFSNISVTFGEPLAVIPGNALTLIEAGVDKNFDTADDVVVPSSSVTPNPDRTILTLHTSNPLPPGKYRATLKAGAADIAGNARQFPVDWSFQVTSIKPRVVATVPAESYTEIGGHIEEILVKVDYSFPPDFLDLVKFGLREAGADGVLGNADDQVNQFSVTFIPETLTFRLVLNSPLPGGKYRLSVSGPAITAKTLDFTFRTVENRWRVDVSGRWSVATNWTGGAVLPNDILVIDRPVAGIETVIDSGYKLKKLFTTAGTVFDSGSLTVGEAIFEGPVSARAGGVSLAGGVSHVFNRLTASSGLSLYAHILLLESGATANFGDVQVQFGSAHSRFIVKPGALLELTPTNTARLSATVILTQGATDAHLENEGEIVKTGLARFGLGINFLNTARVSVEQGLLAAGNSATNYGTIEVASGARVEITGGLYHGQTGRILGSGEVELSGKVVLDGAYEFAGITEVRGDREVLVNSSLRSTAPWIISGPLTFNGLETVLTGPVTLSGTYLQLNSPTETIISDLRFDPASINNRIGGNGFMTFPTNYDVQEVPLLFVDTVLIKFPGPLQIHTNLTAQPSGTNTPVVDLVGPVQWSGGLLSGNLQLRPGALLEMKADATEPVRSAFLPQTNVGILRKTGAGSIRLGSTSGNAFVNSGTLEVIEGNLTVLPLTAGTYLQREGGVTRVDGSFFARTYLYKGGTLTGHGTNICTSDPDSVNEGIRISCQVSPGEPFGVLSFRSSGTLHLLTNSHTIIDIGGPTPGTEYDQIICERRININGGALEIRLANGYTPPIGQEFTILLSQTSSRLGTFSDVAGLAIASDRHFRVTYDSTSVKLRVEAGP